MEAYDSLPSEVRQALREAMYDYYAPHFADEWRKCVKNHLNLALHKERLIEDVRSADEYYFALSNAVAA
jgi:hypothetical protein